MLQKTPLDHAGPQATEQGSGGSGAASPVSGFARLAVRSSLKTPAARTRPLAASALSNLLPRRAGAWGRYVPPFPSPGENGQRKRVPEEKRPHGATSYGWRGAGAADDGAARHALHEAWKRMKSAASCRWRATSPSTSAGSSAHGGDATPAS